MRQIGKRIYHNITSHKWQYGILGALSMIIGILAMGGAVAIYVWWKPPFLSFSDADFADKVQLDTSKGKIIINLDQKSPLALATFSRLVREGFYNKTKIHRIVPNLLIEGGDPLTMNDNLRDLWGQGGSASVFKNETHLDDKMVAGTFAFSGSGLGTYGSHFFILTKDTPWLKGKHTILGKVESGMDVVREIEKTEHTVTGMPVEDVEIYKLSEL